MRKWLTRILFFASLYFSCAAAQPGDIQGQVAPDPYEAIEFRLAGDVLPHGEVMLSNGVVVSPSDWRTLVLAKIPKLGASSDRTPTCTGTLIGPKTILLAAHCVDNPLGQTRKALLAVDGREAELACEIHPTYHDREPKLVAPRGSDDYALCSINYRGPVPRSVSDLEFEVLDLQFPLSRGTPVLMTGYGCSELRVVDKQLDWDLSDRLLRIGDSVVDTPAGALVAHPYYLTIRSANGSAPAVCPGDSGGPLFVGASTAVASGQRRVVGVNSAVALEMQADHRFDLISRVSTLGNRHFRAWIADWIARNQTRIGAVCGVTHPAGRSPCRD